MSSLAIDQERVDCDSQILFSFHEVKGGLAWRRRNNEGCVAHMDTRSMATSYKQQWGGGYSTDALCVLQDT